MRRGYHLPPTDIAGKFVSQVAPEQKGLRSEVMLLQDDRWTMEQEWTVGGSVGYYFIRFVNYIYK